MKLTTALVFAVGLLTGASAQPVANDNNNNPAAAPRDAGSPSPFYRRDAQATHEVEARADADAQIEARQVSNPFCSMNCRTDCRLRTTTPCDFNNYMCIRDCMWFRCPEEDSFGIWC